MAKVNFLNQGESFISESYISQLHGNVNKKTRKVLYLLSNEKKNAGKELNKIEERFAERKYIMSSLKIKC